MPNSYTNLHYHIVFATKGRKRFIEPAIAGELHTFLGGGIRARGGTAVRINGTADHVHILAGLRADVALSDLMRDVKANSSGWIHNRFSTLADFAWQAGYGAFTVSQSQIEAVARYIDNQQEHHREMTFEDEFRRLLVAHNVAFEERYLFNE